MSGLVEELQRKALDSECSISDLLRHGLLTARKLKVSSTSTWINAELSGYGSDEADVPEYRRIYGEPLAKNPYSGWVPIRMPTADLDIKISQIALPNKVAELEEFTERGDGSHLYLSFPSHRAYLLRDILATDWNIALRIPKSSIKGVIDEIRSKILDWAARLEEEGIHGEGMSFTSKEVEAAKSIVTYMTTNNYSNINNSQIQHQSNSSSQTLTITNESCQDLRELVAKIQRELTTAAIPADLQNELLSDIGVVSQQLEVSKPKRSIIRAALESFTTTIGSAAASGIAAHALDWTSQIQSWLSNQ
ncbi:hypothetical protein [Burkholderia cepacia]|uniref:AbiTii domain-containing protein n=1 Tax=Burkholderia cepacia TaxID=292 RepID=UPI002019C7DA|nr:hypothetical protein [Burkholderia cepacia]UQO36562.1 hypothetical protein L0Z22_28300 [Burkholderia cepacia]UQO50889.1 hypothetical protein L0Z05_34430 [Burkholderia cepacia]UQP05048.1 hypothetical protein L0Z01_11240 [Burkholderia cepacia]